MQRREGQIRVPACSMHQGSCEGVWRAHQGVGVGVDVGERRAQVRGGRAEAEEAERVVHPVLPRIVH